VQQQHLLSLGALLFCAPALAAELPGLHADISAVTVSGVSSGGYMAVQMHVAHSASVKGAGVIAGGPYYCAMGSLRTAYYNCMTPGWWTPLPRAAFLKSATDGVAAAGRIDATAHLSTAKVWLFTGTRDHTVLPEVVRELEAYYALYGIRAKLVADKPAGHAMVTTDAGNKDCAATKDPYINDCDYDAAGELLRHLIGPLKPAGKDGPLREFDEGLVYVPGDCEKARCRVHVVFHGCRQSAGEIGDRFAREAGYNRWAETNRLIVLYPQVKATWFPFNPRACWDWWGYTDAAYHTKDGAQIRAVWAMLERLGAPRQSASAIVK
jgi:poly(3-hydroxybutyrate) depolymerase